MKEKACKAMEITGKSVFLLFNSMKRLALVLSENPKNCSKKLCKLKKNKFNKVIKNLQRVILKQV
ncbi:MAG: hypothetical protein ABH821_06265 [archaeon]